MVIYSSQLFPTTPFAFKKGIPTLQILASNTNTNSKVGKERKKNPKKRWQNGVSGY